MDVQSRTMLGGSGAALTVGGGAAAAAATIRGRQLKARHAATVSALRVPTDYTPSPAKVEKEYYTRDFRYEVGLPKVPAENRTASAIPMDSIVEMESGMYRGSGWVIEPGIVVTNQHVVGSASRDTVGVSWKGKGHEVSGQVLAADESMDLAIVHVPGLTAPPMAIGEMPKQSAEINLLGYPSEQLAGGAELGLGQFRFDGYSRLTFLPRTAAAIRGFEDDNGRTWLELKTGGNNAGHLEGMSGGVMADKHGRAVATLSSYGQQGSEAFEIGTSAEEATKMLDRVRPQLDAWRSGLPGSASDAVEAVSLAKNAYYARQGLRAAAMFIGGAAALGGALIGGGALFASDS
jgi:hypothetical protein